MHRLAALALAASLLAGCADKDPSPAPAGDPPASAPAPETPSPTTRAPTGPEVSATDALRRITELADKICACADRACAEATHTAFQAENEKLAGRPHAKPTPAEAGAMQEQAKRFSGCVQRLK